MEQLSVQPRFSRKQAWLCVGALILSALLVRLMVAYITVHFYDISYYFDWALGAASDFSGAYENIENLDYPPLFLFFLYFTGKVLAIPAVQAYDPYVMILLKGWQIVFDLLIAVLLYMLFRRRSETVGVVACAVWVANPSMLLNTAYWGQTDSMMLLFLLLAFAMLISQKPVWAAVAMALACLAKFQSLYFLPLFGLALLTAFPPKRILYAIGAGLGTGIGIFLPFMLRSGWTLPWRVYFGGFASYPGASLNAFNYFSLCGLNRSSSNEKLFGVIPCEVFSWCAIALMLVLLAYFYFTATDQSLWLLALFTIQTIFMFTTRMHERYQVPALLFCLAAAITHRSVGLFACYMGLTAVTFFNQFIVLEDTFMGRERQAWMNYFDEIMQAGSFVNLLLYGLTVFFMVRILYRGGMLPLRNILREIKFDRKRC